ncbi:MAG: tetratricopeptide repeat protein, partial [Candidatus Omnitrophota bacterium]|nr:tetratricopeptide repeat protein [Candidatus Omnitrophota bacterium]
DYLDKGLFDMAEKEFDVVRSLEAEDTSVLRDNEWNKKIGVFQEKIKLEPYNARANYLLGKIYYQLGMYGLAMVNFQKSIQVSPRYKGNDYNIGIAYNNLGASCIQKGKFDKAISNYKKAIRINPVLYPSHYGLGIAYWRKGNYEEAIRSCRYILKNKPDYLLAQYIIGVCYEQKRDYSEAIEEYKEVLKKVSSSKTFSILQCVSLNLARCYINMGMKDKASEQLNNFQIGFSYLDERHNPNGLLQFFSFADSFTIDGKEYHGKEEIKRALKDKFIEFVTTEEIKNKDDLYQKAQKLFDSGNIYLVFDLNDEALELLQKSKKFGGDSKTIFSIGIAYLQKGLLEKAVDEFYKAIRVDSSYRNYFDGIYNQLFFDEESFSSEVR